MILLHDWITWQCVDSHLKEMNMYEFHRSLILFSDERKLYTNQKLHRLEKTTYIYKLLKMCEKWIWKHCFYFVSWNALCWNLCAGWPECDLSGGQKFSGVIFKLFILPHMDHIWRKQKTRKHPFPLHMSEAVCNLVYCSFKCKDVTVVDFSTQATYQPCDVIGWR